MCRRLELHAHIRLKDLVLVERIDWNIARTSSAKRPIDAPGVGPCEVKANGIGHHVPHLHGYAFLVNTAIEDIRINKVDIERILLGALIPAPDLPVVLCVDLANSRPEHPSVMRPGVINLSPRAGAIVTLDIVSEFTEDAHWQAPGFPADFPW